MANLIDSYSESNQNDSHSLCGFTGYPRYAFQGFAVPAGDDLVLDSCKFFLARYGAITGTAVALVYAHTGTYGSGGKPTGSVLATSDTVDVSGLGTEPSYALTTFTFSGGARITLTNNTKYCIVIKYTVNGGDSQQLLVGRKSTSGHAGNDGYGDATPAWTAATGDLCFYVYSEVTTVDYDIVCEQGSYSLTGQTLGLGIGYTLALAQGAYVLTGQAIAMAKGFYIAAEQGAYTLTGQALTMIQALIFSLDQGAYTLTGQAMTMSKQFAALVAEMGSYVLTGFDASVTAAYTMALEYGSYALTGIALTMNKAWKMTMEMGSYTLTGFGAFFLGWFRRIKPERGTYTGRTKPAIGTYTKRTKPQH